VQGAYRDTSEGHLCFSVLLGLCCDLHLPTRKQLSQARTTKLNSRSSAGGSDIPVCSRSEPLDFRPPKVQSTGAAHLVQQNRVPDLGIGSDEDEVTHR
jgi:hypothetical protein